MTCFESDSEICTFVYLYEDLLVDKFEQKISKYVIRSDTLFFFKVLFFLIEKNREKNWFLTIPCHFFSDDSSEMKSVLLLLGDDI